MFDRVKVPTTLAAPPFIGILALALLLSGCIGQSTTRLGMVKDPKTDLMFGSIVERSLVTDATFYNNRKMKVRIRNTSGDVAFGLREFTDRLRSAYAANGYEPTMKDDFGLLVDVNVKYSGQIQTNLSSEYGFLGAAGGAVTGAAISGDGIGAAGGALAGATVGAILGSYITEDTYIIIANVTFGVIKKSKKSKKKITFSRSEKLKNIDDPDEEDKVYNRGFKKAYSTNVAVFAGGTNTPQSKIAEQVRQRIIRIVSDFI